MFKLNILRNNKTFVIINESYKQGSDKKEKLA